MAILAGYYMACMDLTKLVKTYFWLLILLSVCFVCINIIVNMVHIDLTYGIEKILVVSWDFNYLATWYLTYSIENSFFSDVFPFFLFFYGKHKSVCGVFYRCTCNQGNWYVFWSPDSMAWYALVCSSSSSHSFVGDWYRTIGVVSLSYGSSFWFCIIS
jgi:hypothetical protein